MSSPYFVLLKTEKKRVWASESALVLCTLIWSSTFVIIGQLLTLVPPIQVLLGRFVLASVLLTAYTWWSWPSGQSLPWRSGILLGLWLAAGFGFQAVGLAYTTPARSAFITGFSVVLPSLFTALERRSSLTQRMWLGVILAGCGITWISWPGYGQGFNVGDALTIVSALAYGAHIYFTSHYAADSRPDALTAIQIGTATCVFGIAGVLSVVAAHHALPGDPPTWVVALAGRPCQWNLPVLLGISYLALFATVLAYFLQTYGQQRVPAARAGILFALEPLLAAILSVLLGLDTPTFRLCLGGALVVAGILFSREE